MENGIQLCGMIRDILHFDGTQTKDWFESYSIEEVLTIGQKDIMENWLTYHRRFLKEMKS
jgi:hypothetical protein